VRRPPVGPVVLVGSHPRFDDLSYMGDSMPFECSVSQILQIPIAVFGIAPARSPTTILTAWRYDPEGLPEGGPHDGIGSAGSGQNTRDR